MARILAVDQATIKSGWCDLNNGKVLASGSFSVSNKKARVEVRIAEVKRWLKAELDKRKPEAVVLEEVPPTTMGRSVTVLSQLFGVLENLLLERKENYFVPTVQDWRAEIGIKANLECICPACGATVQRITPAHVKKCCNLTFVEFKAKYGKKSVERDEREVLKAATIAWVLATYGIDCEKDDDRADAIALATYMHRRLN